MSAVLGIVAAAALFVAFGLATLLSGRAPACGECGKRDRSECRTCGSGTIRKEATDG